MGELYLTTQGMFRLAERFLRSILRTVSISSLRQHSSSSASVVLRWVALFSFSARKAPLGPCPSPIEPLSSSRRLKLAAASTSVPATLKFSSGHLDGFCPCLSPSLLAFRPRLRRAAASHMLRVCSQSIVVTPSPLHTEKENVWRLSISKS